MGLWQVAIQNSWAIGNSLSQKEGVCSNYIILGGKDFTLFILFKRQKVCRSVAVTAMKLYSLTPFLNASFHDIRVLNRENKP